MMWEEEEVEESEEEFEQEETVPEWSSCTCVDCDRMNTVEIEWESWEPPSPVLSLLKASIDKVPC